VLAVEPAVRKSDHRNFGRDVETTQDWRGSTGRWLTDTVDHLRASGLRTRELVRRGEPAAEAVEAAGDGYDLVAFGAKGRSEAPFFGPESVGLALLERAPTSVLLIRDRAKRGVDHRLPTPQHPLRVLLAVDGREPTEGAVKACASLLAPGRAQVEVLTVAEAGLGEVEARKVARRVADMLTGRGIETSVRATTGDPVGVILEAAQEADLVVLGSRATIGPGESRVGSVGLSVAFSSPCSVLVVRDRTPLAVPAHAEAPAVAVPFDIAYENLEPVPAAERHVLRGLARLERLAPDLVRVRTTLARRGARREKGDLYQVSLELTGPGPDVYVSRTAPLHSENEDLLTAIGEAFDKARRRILESHAVARGDVKSHEPMARGRVTELFPDYGFIRGTDGRVVYFHAHSVLDDAWPTLEVGAEVRFVEETGEQGPQATSVTVLKRGAAAV
jgi:nucleotide-binding universal stress UspA family protein/cold shock CspA family protein